MRAACTSDKMSFRQSGEREALSHMFGISTMDMRPAMISVCARGFEPDSLTADESPRQPALS
jgi:hypothetical protein